MSKSELKHWIVKQEPESYPWSQFVEEGGTAWTGVRNFQARNFLRAMSVGDLVAYYHSGDEKQVVGVAHVTAGAVPDPTAEEGDWSSVDLAPIAPVPRPVTLAEIKADPTLREMLLARHSRLSVSPVTPEQWDRLMELAGGFDAEKALKAARRKSR
jgi:predicted RNA-binding protein with PUA-like domain